MIRQIVTNPLIIAIVLALLAKALRVPVSPNGTLFIGAGIAFGLDVCGGDIGCT